MVTEEQVRESLKEVLVPGVMRSLLMLNLVRKVTISDQEVNITLASAALNEGTQDWIKTKVKGVVEKLPEVNKVGIEFTEVKPTELNQIDHIIAVMSGKGGVGKSLVSSLIGVALKRRGYEIAILDADITGPSIPKMFGITSRPSGSNTGILPVLSRSGIEIMSINLLLPQEDDAVIWRGPLISKTITQFWEDVLWGKLDYLIVDLPPGTADAALTVMQTLPISGVIIVFTPQDLVDMIVRKAINMAQKMDKPVLGVVENMSYLYIPEIDKRIELFGKSRGEEMARAAKAPLLGQLPIDPELARLCDEGSIERYDSEIIKGFGESLPQLVPATKTKAEGEVEKLVSNPATPIELTDGNFAEAVKKYSLLVIDCWAEWCAPCKMIAPVIEELARDYQGKVAFGRLDVDSNQSIAAQYQIMSIPTLLIFKNGQLIDQKVGALPKSMLEPEIVKYL